MLSRPSSSRLSKPLVRLAVLGPLAAVLALAGCGSSSKSGDGTCTTDADCPGASQCDLSTKTCTGGGAGGASSGSGSGSTGTAMSGFDQFQEENLKDINMYRATLNIAPVVLDQTLTTFALAGTLEETMDHSPHAHFIAASNNGSLWKDGFTSQAGENQGDPTGWPVLSNNPVTNELDQVDAVQKDMFDEGPGTGEAHGHYENIMNAAFKRVGIGLMEVDSMLYLTNDFSN
jgi:Cysteine-rich secretory protein family